MQQLRSEVELSTGIEGSNTLSLKIRIHAIALSSDINAKAQEIKLAFRTVASFDEYSIEDLFCRFYSEALDQTEDYFIESLTST